MTLSQDAVRLLAQMFGPQSNVNIPIAWAGIALEIRAWVATLQQAGDGR